MKPQDAAAGEDRLCLDGCSLHAMTMLCYVYSQGSLPCCCVNFLDQNVCVCVCACVCVCTGNVMHNVCKCVRMTSVQVCTHDLGASVYA